MAFLDRKPWTVMVYLGGQRNGLESANSQIVENFGSVPELHHVDVVYQIANSDRTVRGWLRGGGGEGSRQVIWEGAALDTTDPRNLTAFVDWATETYPSRWTALFAKDHGAGWVDRSFGNIPFGSGIFQQGTGTDARFMPTASLRAAIEHTQIRRVDLLGLDACELGDVEVAYELRNSTSVLVTSESSERTNGWPYPQLLTFLNERHGDVAPRAFAEEVVRAGKADPQNFTLGAVQVDWMSRLAAAIDELGKQLWTNLEAVADWVTAAKIGEITTGMTLSTLTSELRKQKDPELCEAKVLDAIDAELRKATVAGSGLGIFFPGIRGAQSIAYYAALELARHTSWVVFVGKLNQKLLSRAYK